MPGAEPPRGAARPAPSAVAVPVFAGVFERLAGAMRDLCVPAACGRPPDAESWLSARDVVEDPGAFVRAQLNNSGARSAGAVRDVAIDLAGDVSWRAWGAPILFYAVERRVPDLAPGNVLLRYESGYLAEVAFPGGRFAALAGDPLAGEAARVFGREAEMRRWMRESLEDLLGPLIREIRAATRVGERTLWGRASDLAAQRFLWTGELCGDWAWCGVEAEAFVKAEGSPLNRNNAFFEVEHGGRRGAFMRRSVCCREYRAPGGGHCEQCPLLPRQELERRALEVLAGLKGVERWS